MSDVVRLCDPMQASACPWDPAAKRRVDFLQRGQRVLPLRLAQATDVLVERHVEVGGRRKAPVVLVGPLLEGVEGFDVSLTGSRLEIAKEHLSGVNWRGYAVLFLHPNQR